ncbi:hypothetical protein COOONC_25566 [Cooperia oncophora]
MLAASHKMRRFMDVSSPAISSRAHDPSEDISFGYPFSLCLVDESWEWCGQCPALRFCRGCAIRPDSTAACEDDESVAETWSRHFAPSSLEHCLEKFSCPETLDALIHCDTCNEKTKRDKRFEFLRSEGRMGKCKRVITFPLRQFDPAPFVDGNGEKSKYECIAIAVSFFIS